MKKIFKYSVFLLVPLISLASVGCARTATNKNANKIIRVEFKVKGRMILDNSNVTYYLVLYAPRVDNPSVPLDTSVGPRINSASLTKGNSFLEGRLPFIDALPGDQPSKWTDFFYVTSVSGKASVGRGRIDVNGAPVIYDRNYANANTKLTSNNGFQIEFYFNQLNNGQANTNTIMANLASSDNIDSGIGTVFDSWKLNTPFPINVSTGGIDNQQDITSTIVLRRTPTIPNPVLPLGVNADDVNITDYTVTVAQ